MRIAIVTLPLHTNYGGILQAYALRKVLMDKGHEVDVLDKYNKLVMTPSWKMPLVYAKRAFLNILSGGNGPEIFREKRIIREHPVVSQKVATFINENIAPRVLNGYSDVREGEYDAFVAGSDQIWRPKYFGKIEDAFLDFTMKWNVRRVAYAASFGTENLEYTYEQIDKCSELLKRFDAVSVREAGGVELCDEWFDCERVMHVLDPVMLIDPAIYKDFAGKAVRHRAESKVLKYILDETPDKMALIQRVAAWLKTDVHDASVAPREPDKPLTDRIVPSMEEWLAGFVDSDFVVTDSFHGCVLSIMLHKKFIVLANPNRGMSRLLSLLEMFGLEDRLVHGIDPDDDGEYYLQDPDWDAVDKVLAEWKAKSLNFLYKVI